MPTDTSGAAHAGAAGPETAAEAQHYLAQSARQVRAQSVQRFQLGLFGLFAMLLIVGLANIIMDRAQTVEAEDQQVIAADQAEQKPAIDPLADAGVVPASDPTPEPGQPASPSLRGER